MNLYGIFGTKFKHICQHERFLSISGKINFLLESEIHVRVPYVNKKNPSNGQMNSIPVKTTLGKTPKEQPEISDCSRKQMERSVSWMALSLKYIMPFPILRINFNFFAKPEQTKYFVCNFRAQFTMNCWMWIMWQGFCIFSVYLCFCKSILPLVEQLAFVVSLARKYTDLDSRRTSHYGLLIRTGEKSHYLLWFSSFMSARQVLWLHKYESKA